MALVSSEDVNGIVVCGPTGLRIGTIDHLVFEKTTGRIAYAVTAFAGSPGLYPLPWAALTYDNSRDAYTTAITEGQWNTSPVFEFGNWDDRGWEERIHFHYGVRPYWEARS
jgi:hypothetical protein